MIGAEAIVKCLEEEKTKVIFGYSGVAIDPFWNSILSTKIKTVLIRTEQNAAHLASGYANENVLQMCVTITLLQVTNNMGREKEVTPFIVKQDGFNRISFEPEETE